MKAFASQGDLKPKKISFRRLSKSCWAFTTEGDPNSGVIAGDDGVMVVDAQATPLMAREVIQRIRRVTSKPIRYVVLSHYHAVRVLGASAYKAIRYTRDFVRGLYASARRGVAARKSLKEVYQATRRRMDPAYAAYPIYEHCMPFDVSRAYDEARGVKQPRIWTAKRDREMWGVIA